MEQTIQSGVDRLSQSEHWDRMYESLNSSLKSPFFSRGYYASYQTIEMCEVECFWAQDDDKYFFYPYIIKEIDDSESLLGQIHYDISGAYGYSGPLCNTRDIDFIRRANELLKDYLTMRKVVTEFVRYCPVIENRHYHLYPEQISVLDNVYVSIEKGIDHVWSDSFGHRVRTAVRKGASYGLRTEVKQGNEVTLADMEAFYQVYISTMQRNDADSYYYFDMKYFLSMLENMRESLILALTYHESTVITTELVLCDGDIAYGFLGGTLKDFFALKANTFQRWELLKVLADSGVKKYSMGGGSAKNDSIYAFKMTFANGCENPFHIGRYVFDDDAYQKIVLAWGEKYPELYDNNKNRIQCYRMKG